MVTIRQCIWHSQVNSAKSIHGANVGGLLSGGRGRLPFESHVSRHWRTGTRPPYLQPRFPRQVACCPRYDRSPFLVDLTKVVRSKFKTTIIKYFAEWPPVRQQQLSPCHWYRHSLVTKITRYVQSPLENERQPLHSFWRGGGSCLGSLRLTGALTVQVGIVPGRSHHSPRDHGGQVPQRSSGMQCTYTSVAHSGQRSMLVVCAWEMGKA